ncbi:FtsK/SpoIIIE domain-containing protein [Anaerosinus gibii]|uniref:FtsK/SpoIIIE domain-containing protein n=1 Tax=Selenobaculum gibii TaxID=3054208 RepID=A0A9Y2AJD7_9FIRM|nr:FtsK/SpoIIIE domain-containing protein [Selenobaculum gbiensis]WIW71457.1 FtsK/SpoIIIE domain-containing protein [Selenobaculum gbiensis]
MDKHNNYYSEVKADDLSDDIVKQFEHYGVDIKIKDRLLQKDRVIFEVKLKGATRESQLFARASDVQLKLKLPLFQPFKNNLTIFIAASDLKIKYNSLPKLLNNPAYPAFKKKMKMRLPFATGYSITSNLVIVDLSSENHLLIGGSSGSGKSVALKCLILSLITGKSVAKLNLLIIDVGANDLMPFDGIPHLSCPVIRNTEAGLKALIKLKKEMERRIDLEFRNNDEFMLLPRIVCVIDEFPALISQIGDKKMLKLLTVTISSLLQRGRHAKIHMVLAAQNPTIKNMNIDLGNITARMAFTCAKRNFSETIIGESGAEHLLGNGDMYFKSSKYKSIQRMQGVFISPNELKESLLYLKMKPFPNQSFEHMFVISEMDSQQSDSVEKDDLNSKSVITKKDANDKLFAQIVIWSLERESISHNMICEVFHIGWKRAKEFLNKLHNLEIAGDMYEKLPRAILPESVEDISLETIDFLSKIGVSVDDVAAAIQKRNREL